MVHATSLSPRSLAVCLAAAVAVEQCRAEAQMPTPNKNLRWQPPQESHRTVDVGDVAARLDRAFRGGNASAIDELEARFAPTFAALPKNEHGLLSHQAFEYVIQRYFTQDFGMHISGIGGDEKQEQPQWGGRHNVLQTMAPFLMESLLEEKEAGRGLSLRDLAAMASTLQEFIMDDYSSMIPLAYEANNLSMTRSIGLAEVGEVSLSMLVFVRDGMDGRGGDKLDVPIHNKLKALRGKSSVFQEAVMYLEDQAMSWAYMNEQRLNPFHAVAWPLDAVSQVLRGAVKSRGKVQNFDCLAMKDYMVELDPMGSGRVPLSIFYDQPDKHIFRFNEPLDYLAQIGALDMSNPLQPGVVIPNYVLGPANCLRSAALYTYCCVSECEALMTDIEFGAQGPYATTAFLFDRVSRFSAGTVEAPREIPAGLKEKLEQVAERHGGLVPLHGRLFAQWLHFVFPSECPYPQVTEQSRPNVDFQVSFAESVGKPIEPSLAAWTNEEALPLASPPGDKRRGPVRAAANVVFSCFAVFAMLRVLLGNAQDIRRHLRQMQGRNLKLPSMLD